MVITDKHTVFYAHTIANPVELHFTANTLKSSIQK